MRIRNYAAALPATALAAVLLVTACSSGGSSSHPSAHPTTSPPAPAASTVAVTDQEDSNWAGYVIGNSPETTTAATTTGTATSFSSVSGSWTQPAVNCAAGSPSDSAFWVGLGGYAGTHLEQTGTSADCSKAGQPVYSVWYELVPAAQVAVTMTVQPGDKLTARVGVSGDKVSISISDLTRHAAFSKQLTMSDPTVSSAEWIAEAPSRCETASSQDCHILSLADFGTVAFTGASASAAGKTGAITSGLAPVTALTLEANPSLGRELTVASEADASPAALSASGSSFTVSWEQPEMPQPTAPYVPSGPLYY
jgi:Peptidase A4 family